MAGPVRSGHSSTQSSPQASRDQDLDRQQLARRPQQAAGDARQQSSIPELLGKAFNEAAGAIKDGLNQGQRLLDAELNRAQLDLNFSISAKARVLLKSGAAFRAGGAAELSKEGVPAINALRIVARAKDCPDEIRAEAISAIWRLNHDQGREEIRHLLQKPKGELAISVSGILSDLRDQKADFRPLFESLLNDPKIAPSVKADLIYPADTVKALSRDRLIALACDPRQDRRIRAECLTAAVRDIAQEPSAVFESKLDKLVAGLKGDRLLIHAAYRVYYDTMSADVFTKSRSETDVSHLRRSSKVIEHALNPKIDPLMRSAALSVANSFTPIAKTHDKLSAELARSGRDLAMNEKLPIDVRIDGLYSAFARAKDYKELGLAPLSEAIAASPDVKFAKSQSALNLGSIMIGVDANGGAAFLESRLSKSAPKSDFDLDDQIGALALKAGTGPLDRLAVSAIDPKVRFAALNELWKKDGRDRSSQVEELLQDDRSLLNRATTCLHERGRTDRAIDLFARASSSELSTAMYFVSSQSDSPRRQIMQRAFESQSGTARFLSERLLGLEGDLGQAAECILTDFLSARKKDARGDLMSLAEKGGLSIDISNAVAQKAWADNDPALFHSLKDYRLLQPQRTELYADAFNGLKKHEFPQKVLRACGIDDAHRDTAIGIVGDFFCRDFTQIPQYLAMVSVGAYSDSFRAFSGQDNIRRLADAVDKAADQAERRTGLRVAREDFANPDLLTHYAKALRMCCDLNIDHPLRLAPRDLIISVGQRAETAQQTRADDRPTVAVIYPKSDSNGAFYQTGQLISGFRDQGFRVDYYEAASDDAVVSAAKDAARGRKIWNLVLGGHGEQTSLHLTDPNELDRNGMPIGAASELGDGQKLDIGDRTQLKQLSRYVDPSGRILLISCSTGSHQEPGGNLADAIHLLSGVRSVFAPRAPAAATAGYVDEKGSIKLEFRDFLTPVNAYDTATDSGAEPGPQPKPPLRRR